MLLLSSSQGLFQSVCIFLSLPFYIIVLVVVPCGGPKKSPRTFIYCSYFFQSSAIACNLFVFSYLYGSICFMFCNRFFVLFEPYIRFHTLSLVEVPEWPPVEK